MSQKRLTTWQKATALVPLALLSGAWTTSLAMSSTASASTQDTASPLPDGTTVPDEAIEAPASVSRPGSLAPGVPAGAADRVIESASANGVPAAALAAYQRAEQVISSADESCNLTWQLVAAIGRVESDHGRYGGNVLGEDGKSRPGIFGIPLDGSNGTAEIRDSDAGRYDDDQVYDRAVGPMQFIPSTWATSGVDASGDGFADPHNAIDAIHAAAGYLCAIGADDPTDIRGAIWSYNRSSAYVDEVFALAARYVVPAGVPADPVLVAAVLGNQRLDIYDQGRQDIAAGRIDNRVLAILLLATEHWTLAVSSLQTGHSKCVGGGSYGGCSVSNHWHGRAFDVYRVNDELVAASNADAFAFAVWLSSLDPGLRPDEIGSPWPRLKSLPGHFHDDAHLGHIHAGHD